MKILEGRQNRATYWFSIALIAAIYTGIVLVSASPPHIGEVLLVFVGVPRLHDIGKSGWLIVVPIGLEIVGLIGASLLLPIGSLLQVAGVITFIMAGLVIWLGCVPGQNFANRFGEPPAAGIQWRKPKND